MATVRPASGIGMIASFFYGMVAVPIKEQSMPPKDTKQSAPKTKAPKAATAPAADEAAAPPASPEDAEKVLAEAHTRLGTTGRNDPCPCGSGKKYKKCHLQGDESASIKPAAAPDAQELLMNGWRLFEQRRPGAAEKEFRAALEAKPDLLDARVGIGMARLSAGNADGAKEELGAVLAAGQKDADEMRAKGVKDAFAKTEAQPYLRAAHALGCLAYDQERYADAATDLERVYAIDEGTVGTEARLVAAKSLMKLERAADAVAVLEPATKAEGAGGSRAQVGLALARFATGAESEARAALDAALDANSHYGRAILGRVRRRVENITGTQPGSIEEALVYAQTYGDAWTDAAKKFLEKALDERAAGKRTEAAPADEEQPAAP
jgi:tetratricopeptide (TPR) repeat protein